MRLKIPFLKGRTLGVKRMLPKTLFARSLLILITPVVLIQVISTFMFFDRHWTKMTSRLAVGVAGEIAMIADSLEEDPSPDNVRQMSQYASQYLDLLIGFNKDEKISADNGRSLGFVWESMVAERLADELRAVVRRPFQLDVDLQEKWVEISVQLESGVLNVSLQQRRLFSSSGYIFLLWMISTSMVLLLVAILFMRNQIRPIRRLALAAERFGKGRDVQQFKIEGATEVRQAGQAFLDMSKRIQRQISQRTAMLAGVSHDLRTPLTRLKLQLEMMGDNPDVEAMKGDVREMDKMIEGYLDFVRGEGEEQASPVRLGEFLEKILISARRQGYDLNLSVVDDIYVILRPLAFERCLTNLVNNAFKYAGHAWISARLVENRVQIAVEDDGPGIPEDQYDEVFKPFYRVDSSRNVTTGGVGLGLPIAMDIVHGHGGRIWLERSGYGGLRVMILLPL